jgi:hypothetical protein
VIDGGDGGSGSGGDRRETLIRLIRSEPSMLEALAAVRDLDLPDGWIAAGFVRNRVWDHLHGFERPTPPGDIDVVYFDAGCLDEAVEKRHEGELQSSLPGKPWSVKNQARMAVVNGDPPYRNSAHALACWCETPTPVGARLTAGDGIELIAPLGLDDLFDMIVRPTPHACAHPAKLAQYRDRMARKNWPRLWPGIRVLDL